MKNRTQFTHRQSMLVDSFEVYHYSDVELDSVGVHHHDFYEIYFFLNGTVQYNIEGTNYQLLPGDILLISPQEIHQLRVENGLQPYERIVLWINKAYLEGIVPQAGVLAQCFDCGQPRQTNLLRPSPAQRALLAAKLDELVWENEQDDDESKIASVGILLQFMVELNRLARRKKSLRGGEKPTPLVTAVLEHINLHYGDELPLEEIAGRFYVSKYHLCHEFSRVVGTSLHRYIRLKRLVMAKQLLAGGGPPTSVYRQCGFRDYSNFYRAFKGEYGVSPSDFSI